MDRTIDKKPTESCNQRCTALAGYFLERSSKDPLKHDWLEDGHTFPLMEYYYRPGLDSNGERGIGMGREIYEGHGMRY